ncbi:MAG: glycosyltransferase [Planctomycetota bacterium]
MRLIHLIESFAPSGATTQARLLAEASADVSTVLVSLAPFGPWGDAWRTRGSHSLGRRFAFDPFAWVAWRRLLAKRRPDVVLTTEPKCARFVARAGHGAARWAQITDRPAAVFPAAPYVACSDERHAEAAAAPYVPNAVAVCADPSIRQTVRDELGLADGALLVVAGVRMRRACPVKEIAWAADLLRVVRPGSLVLVAGEGPGRVAAERFAAEAAEPGCVRFIGPRPDWPSLVAAADAVWAPQAETLAATSVVEALAAGRPVVFATSSAISTATPPGVRAIRFDDRAGWVRNTLELLAEAPPEPQAASLAAHTPGEASRRRAEWLLSLR